MAVNVNKEKCKGCTKCTKSCPFEAITMENKLAVIGDACTGCGACIENCPFGAIEKTEEEKKAWIFMPTAVCGYLLSSGKENSCR